MSTLWGLMIAIAIVGSISGFVIWIVGKLRLGLEVDGFGSAFIAAFVIAIVGGMITWLLSMAGLQDGSGLFGGIIHLIISAIVLIVTSRFLSGLKVKGFAGALVASIAIGAVYWLGGLLLGLVIT
jgi:putative membrane protein